MNEFEFTCPHCGQRLKADESFCGQVLSCPSCSNHIAVPRDNPQLAGRRQGKFGLKSMSGARNNSQPTGQRQGATAMRNKTGAEKEGETMKMNTAKWCVFLAVGLLVVVDFVFALSSVCDMACSPRKGVCPATRYISDEIAYSLPAVNEMKCPIEKRNQKYSPLPYEFPEAVIDAVSADHFSFAKDAPVEGVAYKHHGKMSDKPRVRKIFEHGILVVAAHYYVFILTDRHYSVNDELAPGYYIYGGFAIHKLKASYYKAPAFREMDPAVVRKRGLDLKAFWEDWEGCPWSPYATE